MSCRLTPEFLMRRTNRWNRRRGETPQEYLSRVTHLFLSELNLSDVRGIELCPQLSVLYLYDNSLKKIHNLEFAVGLTHLYLQNNLITKLEGLSSLRSLSKLYLGGNLITVVEGVEELLALRELHVENQKLELGEKLHFDPLSLRSLSHSLLLLNISSNSIDTIQELSVLHSLESLHCANNKVSDLVELANFLSRMTMLSSLDLSKNPVCSRQHYRENAIAHGSLRQLDGREIPDHIRQFIHRLHSLKELRKKQSVTPKQSTVEKRKVSKSTITPFLSLHPSYRLYNNSPTVMHGVNTDDNNNNNNNNNDSNDNIDV